MRITPISFDIRFPINLFTKHIVNLDHKRDRERIIKRNMYYKLYGQEKNDLIKSRIGLFIDLSHKIKEYLFKNYRPLKIKSISIFGSSLYSKNNDDYDFLVIVEGEAFDNLKTLIKQDYKKEYAVGISIKGERTLSKKIIKKDLNFNPDLQNKIINRTAISLPWRHLPLYGLDFKENKKVFLKNCYAQTSDLLINAYELYYLDAKKQGLSPERRAQKILSRLFEASKYLSLVSPSKKIEIMKKRMIYLKLRKTKLAESKKLFRRFGKYYNKIIK